MKLLIFIIDMKETISSMKIGVLFSIGLLFSSFFFFSESIAQQNNIEYKIKAGYLYNFTKFISWPENELTTFNLCILGKDPFGPIINPIEKRTVKDKAIRVFRISLISQAKHCQIVYFAKESQVLIDSILSLPGILTVGSQKQTLAVGEAEQFSQAGGMIAFFFRQGKIKIRINLKSLRKSRLEVSAKLLEVADIFSGGEDE